MYLTTMVASHQIDQPMLQMYDFVLPFIAGINPYNFFKFITFLPVG